MTLEPAGEPGAGGVRGYGAAGPPGLLARGYTTWVAAKATAPQQAAGSKAARGAWPRCGPVRCSGTSQAGTFMIFVESRASHELCRLARREATDNRDLQTTEPWMTAKKKFPQQQLWMLPIAPAGEDLPDPKRQELTAALADLLWQFARASSEGETNQEQGGDDGHDELYQDHA